MSEHLDGPKETDRERKRGIKRRMINTATFLLTLVGVGFLIAAFFRWRGYI